MGGREGGHSRGRRVQGQRLGGWAARFELSSATEQGWGGAELRDLVWPSGICSGDGPSPGAYGEPRTENPPQACWALTLGEELVRGDAPKGGWRMDT